MKGLFGWIVCLTVSPITLAQLPATPGSAAPQNQTAPQSQNAPKPAAPLRLQSLTPETKADPFPPVNQKFFTAATPSVLTVDSFLRALWGYDSNRIWRVEAIQTTAAPGVSKVVVFVSERTANAKVQTAVFYTTPDGNHAIADQSGVVSFGATPFAETRATLIARADGPARGAASKDLLLVEFADLQCPHCRDAQKTMDQLAKDFPKARIVYQNYPLVDIHPFAFSAAAYGDCVAQKTPDAFFPYMQAVYDTQGALTPETGIATLNNAVTKAGLDPAAISACAALDSTKARVNASIKLAQDVGVEQTPMISINGHLLPLTGISYDLLKSIIVFQAGQDGISGVAPPLVLR